MYSEVIRESIEAYSPATVIDAPSLYLAQHQDVPEATYYKVISRMTKSGELIRLGKGVYSRPRAGRFGVQGASESTLMQHYLGACSETCGMLVGYRMYNRHRLTTQVSKTIDVYTSRLLGQGKRIGNIRLTRIPFRLSPELIEAIEVLEVVQNHRVIEDLNRNELAGFFLKASRAYRDSVFRLVLAKMKYKKSTIASLAAILDAQGVRHTLNCHLRGTSKYSIIDLGWLYASS